MENDPNGLNVANQFREIIETYDPWGGRAGLNSLFFQIRKLFILFLLLISLLNFIFVLKLIKKHSDSSSKLWLGKPW